MAIDRVINIVPVNDSSQSANMTSILRWPAGTCYGSDRVAESHTPQESTMQLGLYSQEDRRENSRWN